MVPILQSDIGAEKVSVWTASLNSGRPLRAVWLTNTSSETLDAGIQRAGGRNLFADKACFDAIKRASDGCLHMQPT